MGQTDSGVPEERVLRETVHYCNRVYQRYSIDNELYWAPVDEEEIHRMQALHLAINVALDGNLTIPVLGEPQRILDCGCGSADWAIAAANKYPKCDVKAVDICPQLLPNSVPSNLQLIIDDLNGRFTFRSSYFSFVHSQMVAEGISANRWENYVRDIYRVLKPGGWCQLSELYLNAQSDNGTLAADSALSRWSAGYLRGSQLQKDPRIATKLGNLLKVAGFAEIKCQMFKMPMSAWSNDAREQTIAQTSVNAIQSMLYSVGLYPFTRKQGLSTVDFEQLVHDARDEAKDPARKAYFSLYMWTARKPATAP
ncbi:hypothetical protein VHEMI04615 [[Torrubiella] hemipterigena]|uniref:Methyltransferase domain-containing protein n=1 Tax=[Torrubiella] hemipterigena TaxID=1531966 RepID=A0A0A1TEX1_9HYPO|nr:hypothetical protein VHEMI04615 [[Torrubiella] hemipterigena]